MSTAGYRASLPVWSVQGKVTERRFYSGVVAEHMGWQCLMQQVSHYNLMA